MIHFQIPRNSPTLYKSIKCTHTDQTSSPIISNSLSHYLADIKQRIDHQEHDWDVFKRYTNPYEYIHTNIPGKRKSICKLKPLSRSYFKMIELVQFFRLLDVPKPINSTNNVVKGFKSFHLAEGPGGFIEALAHMRNCKSDEYIGMTIIDNIPDPNIPAWKKSQHFLRENPNVKIETGIDQTGDILSPANFKYCREKYGGQMDIITGDGGFDFSVDFNNQEQHIAKLLFGQIVYALCMQKHGGSFILKIFDCFMQHTLDALAILSAFYEKVFITKPQTSRYANSEKYLVCKGFLFNETMMIDVVPVLDKAFNQMVNLDEWSNRNNGFGQDLSDINVLRFLSVPLSISFTSRLEEFNAIFGQQQIENIYYTLALIENKHKQERIDALIKANSQKCVNWCIKHNVIYFPLVAPIVSSHTTQGSHYGSGHNNNAFIHFTRFPSSTEPKIASTEPVFKTTIQITNPIFNTTDQPEVNHFT